MPKFRADTLVKTQGVAIKIVREVSASRDALAELLGKAVQALEMMVNGVADWCEAISERGTSWDDWDECYKYFAYEPTKYRPEAGKLAEGRAVLTELRAALASHKPAGHPNAADT